MARFYVDLTLWFSADIGDDDDLARVYPDIASRVKGKYGVQAFNLRQAPESVAQEQIQEQPEQYVQEEPLQQEEEYEQAPEPVVPTTPPPPQTTKKTKQQQQEEEEEEEEDEYEDAGTPQ